MIPNNITIHPALHHEQSRPKLMQYCGPLFPSCNKAPCAPTRAFLIPTVCIDLLMKHAHVHIFHLPLVGWPHMSCHPYCDQKLVKDVPDYHQKCTIKSSLTLSILPSSPQTYLLIGSPPMA